jgi:hypothetical protein
MTAKGAFKLFVPLMGMVGQKNLQTPKELRLSGRR